MTRPEKSYSHMTDDELIRMYASDDDPLVRELCSRFSTTLNQMDEHLERLYQSEFDTDPLYSDDEIAAKEEQLDLFEELLYMNQ